MGSDRMIQGLVERVVNGYLLLYACRVRTLSLCFYYIFPRRDLRVCVRTQSLSFHYVP